MFNENLDKAMICFRSALKIDHRHYNAWYGMGSIFYRQERLELAEYHFRKAADINKRSAVLQCYLGIVLYAQNNPMKTAEAKQMLKDACIMDPKNPQVSIYSPATYKFSFHAIGGCLDPLPAGPHSASLRTR